MLEIIHGDCLTEMPLLNCKYDLIYADLPYGTTNCSWDTVIPFDLMWDQVLRLAGSKTAIVFHAQQPFTSALIMSNPKMFKYSWVWEKSKATGFLNSKKRPLVAHEDVLVFCKGTPVYYPIKTKGNPYNKGVRKIQDDDDIYGAYNSINVCSEGDRFPRPVQYFKAAESEGKTYHKSQKPLSLAMYIINTYTQLGQSVLDFTAGSGTAGIACRQTGRNCTLIEKDRIHIASLYDRILNDTGKVI
jgi:site-specific DNA-methyltransferase (adenine-specific)